MSHSRDADTPIFTCADFGFDVVRCCPECHKRYAGFPTGKPLVRWLVAESKKAESETVVVWNRIDGIECCAMLCCHAALESRIDEDNSWRAALARKEQA